MAAVNAYIAPQPDGLEGGSWGPDGAAWNAAAGLAILPWERIRVTADPRALLTYYELRGI